MAMYKHDVKLEIAIPTGDVHLDGLLHIPKNAKGLVLFVHGSGSSRFSVRNQYVAHILNKANLATLLFDLLVESEEAVDSYTREFRFDIKLLASRLLDATKWCLNEFKENPMKIGYFGSSTGGGAALVAAAKEPQYVNAVVSRGGRPDLAGQLLPHVKTPTLLLVGGYDYAVIQMNKEALAQMNCFTELEIIPGANHLFEEPGTLEKAALSAKAWFVNYLSMP